LSRNVEQTTVKILEDAQSIRKDNTEILHEIAKLNRRLPVDVLKDASLTRDNTEQILDGVAMLNAEFLLEQRQRNLPITCCKDPWTILAIMQKANLDHLIVNDRLVLRFPRALLAPMTLLVLCWTTPKSALKVQQEYLYDWL
jgi:hypothetical protein